MRIIIVTIIVLVFASFFMVVEGSIPELFVRKKLVKHYTENEEAFQDLETFFKYNTGRKTIKSVEFGLDDGSTVSFFVGLDSIPGVYGDMNVPVTAAKLEPALAYLGWTFERLQALREKLVKINCNHILLNRINNEDYMMISPNQVDDYLFTYNILQSPANGAVNTFGDAIGHSAFGKRIYLVSNTGFHSE